MIARAAGLALAIAAVARPVQDQRPVFRTGIDVVAVDVSVTRGRAPVTGLGVADFQLMDNGVPQQIDAVLTGSVPIDVTIVLDLGGSTATAWPAFRTDVEAMRAGLGALDRIRIVGVGMGTRELVPMRPAREPLPAAAFDGGHLSTALHDGLFLALARPGEPDRRHLVVVFTDGFDNWSVLDGERLPAIAERADAVLHAVVTATPPVAPPPDADGRSSAVIANGTFTNTRLSRGQWDDRIARWSASQRALFDAVSRSGGALHRIENRAAAFTGVLADFRSSYVLRFTPRGVAPGGWHELKVSVPKPGGLTVRARKGYEASR
jgi:hypothetical protein